MQDEIIGVETIRPFAFDTLDLSQTQLRLDRADDGQSDFVLKGENVVGLAVIALSPDMRSRCGINKLPSDAHAFRRFAYAAFEHIAHAKLAPNLLHIDRPTLVGEGRIARDDEQPLDA